MNYSDNIKMKAVGLFAGIGGIELGFKAAGIECEFLCEIDPGAQSILKNEFPGIDLVGDVKTLKSIPATDIVVGGFPCQNLSLAGDNSGIHGEKSSLVNEFFRLISSYKKKPKWLVLENVPFMLWQNKGEAMRHVVKRFEELGYNWAYRVVDARAFGLPQRRRRVIFVASQKEDPQAVLFSDAVDSNYDIDNGLVPCGFYWTEGRAGLGWAVNGVPTLKGGSSIGISSLPAIWFRSSGLIATPHICDAERMQGFKADWTKTYVDGKELKSGFRCKLVGNAVSVPMAKWLGKRLVHPGNINNSIFGGTYNSGTWPNAAYGSNGKITRINISEYPEKLVYKPLESFLKYPTKPLSSKAASGFLKRARAGSLNFADGFLDAVENHITKTKIV